MSVGYKLIAFFNALVTAYTAQAAIGSADQNSQRVLCAVAVMFGFVALAWLAEGVVAALEGDDGDG